MQSMTITQERLHELNRRNRNRYAITACFYDILDYYWEREYRTWRPGLLHELSGEVLEGGVGTGRNLPHYPAAVDLTAVDLSPAMLRRAKRRGRNATCTIHYVNEDVCAMTSIPSNHYDWVIAFFLCCVLPEELQSKAISEFARVLKPGGKFRFLEMQYSSSPDLRKRQNLFAPFVERVYGARFDRRTQHHVENNPLLRVTSTRYLKADTYLLIEGERVSL
jgi:ubiquinone/menaquinone biosynthesis C-methylase UbiE